MKQTRLLKTLLAAVCLFVGTSSVWAESLIFTEDFADETYNVTWGGTSAGGISPAVADGALKVANGSSSGDRSAYIAFGTNAHTGCCRLTFDVAMTKSGWNGRSNYLYVLPTATTDRYPNTTNAALAIIQDSNGAITIAGESVGTYDGVSLTYDLFLNTITGKAKVIVKNGATTIKTISYATTATGINTINLQFNKNSGAFAIDNISFYSLVAPAFTLSEDSKTVSVSGSETVNVTDITGSISVSSNNTAAATASYDAGVVTINGVANGVATVTVTGTNDGLTLDKNIEVTVGAVSTTTVTVNYLCGETPIAAALVLNDVAVGSILTASEVVYDDVIYGTGCRYVNPVLSETLPYTVVEDGVINITYIQQNSVASLNVKAKVGETKYNIKSESLTGKYIGDVVTITYPRLWLVGTTLYSTTESAHSGGYYKWNYTLDGNDAVVEYNTTEATSVVYYSEGENIEGMTADASGNADIRCSDGKGGRSEQELSLTSLGSGIYKLTSRVWGNSGSTYTYRTQGVDIHTQSTVGYLDDKNIKFNVLSGTADIKVQGSGTGNGKVIDYVYIQKLDDSSASIYNGDFENSTWGEGWSGTGTDKAKEFAKQNSSQTWGATDNFAEMWTGTNSSYSTEANLRQILVNVPAGNYTLSADILNSVAEPGGVLYAKVGNDSEITTVAEDASGANKSVSFAVAEPSVVVVGYKTTSINGKNGWIAVDNFELKQFVPATTTSAGKGWATLYSDYALDFANATPATLKAYTATLNGNTVTLTPVQNVPAGTGVVLKSSTTSENTEYSIPVIVSSKTPQGDMRGSATSGTHLDEGDAYLLGINGENKAQFFINSEGTIVAGKAYLPAGNTNEAKALSVVFADDMTGITNANAAEEAAQPAKRIVNGQLVIEKNGKRYNAAGAEF